MSSRSYARNAFETGLNGSIADSDTTITLDSVVGLNSPGKLVIDDDSPTIREYITYAGVSGSDRTGCVRGEEGSIGGVGHNHGDGARVRSVFQHQYLDDIFDDVEALETADTDHVAAGDPHTGYELESNHTKAAHDALNIDADTLDGVDGAAFALLAGAVFTGDVTLQGDPDAALKAATKQYADLMLPLTGGVMTGDITLDADPDAALKAATKQYVDGLAAPGWVDYSGSLTFTNFSLGNGVIDVAEFLELPDIVFVKLFVTMGTTSTVTGVIEVSLPVSAVEFARNTFGAHLQESGQPNRPGACQVTSSTRVRFVALKADATWLEFGGTSATEPFTWGDGDSFATTFWFEPA